MEFSTKIIHTGQSPDLETGAIVPPIYMTSTYIQNSPNSHKGYDYTRAGNPNFTNLETTLAALEDGRYATVFSSGIGATTALFSNLSEQDTIVFANDLYGGTFRLYEKIFKKFGVKLLIVDTQNLKNVENLDYLGPGSSPQWGLICSKVILGGGCGGSSIPSCARSNC